MNILIVLALTLSAAQETRPDGSPESIQARIDALKVEDVAWREIKWESCLLKGLKRSREQKKPVLLWIFIDRPADDPRC